MALLMRTTLAAAALFTALSLPAAHAAAPADSPNARKALAHQLIEATIGSMNVGKMMSAMAQQVQQQMGAAIQQQNPQLTPAQVQRVSEVLGKAATESADDMQRRMMPAMMSAMEGLYAERFNTTELTELVRFQTSAVGRKLMSVTQDDLPRMMAPVFEQMQKEAPVMAQRMLAAVEQLKNEGIELKK